MSPNPEIYEAPLANLRRNTPARAHPATRRADVRRSEAGGWCVEILVAAESVEFPSEAAAQAFARTLIGTRADRG